MRLIFTATSQMVAAAALARSQNLRILFLRTFFTSYYFLGNDGNALFIVVFPFDNQRRIGLHLIETIFVCFYLENIDILVTETIPKPCWTAKWEGTNPWKFEKNIPLIKRPKWSSSHYFSDFFFQVHFPIYSDIFIWSWLVLPSSK